MVDVRRSLPAVPVGLVVTALVTVQLLSVLAEWLDGPGGVLVPWASALGGLVAGGAVGREVRRAAADWSEWHRRLVGYVAALLVGLGVAALFAFAAFAAGFCNLFGEQCTAAERAAMDRYATAAVLSLVAGPAVYFVLDMVTLPWSRR